MKRWKNKRLLILLTSPGTSGGAHVIVQEAQKMLEMGVDVYLYNIVEYRRIFLNNYPLSKVPVLWGVRERDFQKYVKEFDVICASANRTLKYFDFTEAKAAYYIQDFEPYFFEEGTEGYQEAFESYTVRPDLIRITKTNWNNEEVIKNCGVSCNVIGPSVDLEMFYTTKRSEAEQVRICAMIRPETPRRSPQNTMVILKEIKKLYGDRVRITIFGSDRRIASDFYSQSFADFEYDDLGILKHEAMPEVFRNQDIFVDFSSFQAMGLTAMEAMACGCAVIVPQNGGASDFSQNMRNCIAVDSADKRNCFESLCKLIEDNQLRRKLSHNAARDICSFSTEKSAYKFLETIFGMETGESKRKAPIEQENYLLQRSLQEAYNDGKRVYIYGAGVYAKIWANVLEAVGRPYHTFIVSTMEGNPKTLYEHEVITFNELLLREPDLKEIFILVGVSDQYAAQIISQLEKKGVTNIFYSPNSI